MNIPTALSNATHQVKSAGLIANSYNNGEESLDSIDRIGTQFHVFNIAKGRWQEKVSNLAFLKLEGWRRSDTVARADLLLRACEAYVVLVEQGKLEHLHWRR